jgi:CDP-diacylglycerol--glycerol-3-phosphate 3-phosphatidyltransferase
MDYCFAGNTIWKAMSASFLNLPNILTLLRIVLIPIFVLVYYLPLPWHNVLTTLIFGLAAITDWFDGYLARRYNQTTPFGAFLDPVADKLIVATVLVLMVQHYADPYIAIAAAIIIGREITISALREWMAELGQRAAVAVSAVGKIKTTMQMIALFMLLYEQPLFGLPIYEMGYIALFLAAVLTLWSMFIYLRAALPLLIASGKL